VQTFFEQGKRGFFRCGRSQFLVQKTKELFIELCFHVLIHYRLGQDLRPSLALCQEEKDYRKQRKKLVKQALINLMEERNNGGGGPRNIREVLYFSVSKSTFI